MLPPPPIFYISVPKFIHRKHSYFVENVSGCLVLATKHLLSFSTIIILIIVKCDARPCLNMAAASHLSSLYLLILSCMD